jgi:hypothetical protein
MWETRQNTYDALSRLTEANYNSGAEILTYGFDPAGNRLSQSVALNGGGPTVDTYTYNELNQIADMGYAYDDNGNLTSDGVNTYVWDRANRLLSMGGHSYAYDGLGARIAQTVSSVVTDYLFDYQQGLAQVISATTGANTEIG